MLFTIQLADIKLANHYNDSEAIYVSDLGLKNISTKKGLISDAISFSLHKDIFDTLDKPFAYSCHNSPVKVFVEDKLIFQGYVDKLSTNKTNLINFSIQSLSKWYLATSATPKIATNCQNQLGAVNCGIDIQKFKVSFRGVKIDGFTGHVELKMDKPNNTISLGAFRGKDFSSGFSNGFAAAKEPGNVPAVMDKVYDGNNELCDGNNDLYDGNTRNNNPMFFELENWVDAYVVINGLYKTTIVNVVKDAIYLALNFTNTKLRAETLDVYLKCDKTYGQCYKKFNNVSNFWGFANNRDDIETIDIFSATNLTYCGQEEVERLNCPTDNNLYGIET